MTCALCSIDPRCHACGADERTACQVDPAVTLCSRTTCPTGPPTATQVYYAHRNALDLIIATHGDGDLADDMRDKMDPLWFAMVDEKATAAVAKAKLRPFPHRYPRRQP